MIVKPNKLQRSKQRCKTHVESPQPCAIFCFSLAALARIRACNRNISFGKFLGHVKTYPVLYTVRSEMRTKTYSYFEKRCRKKHKTAQANPERQYG